jgi:signal transduction histidine kinase
MKKILVIEDTQSIREEALDLLQLESFEAVGAENGVVGVQIAQKQLPDLIICDIMMPELDGYGVLQTLRKNPTTTTIPFIFLTAKTDKTDVRQGMTLGADDYLTKPFTMDELLSAVKTRLEKQAALAGQSEKKLDQLRTSISYSLPHELLTPLNAILGFSGILVEDGATMEPDEIIDMAGDIHQSAVSLNRLVQNYLVYAEIEITASNPDKLAALRNHRLANVKEIIENAAIQKAQMAKREADLNLELVNTAAQVSDDGLKKIVEELVDNAFKFSRAGTSVRVETAASGEVFRLKVTDSGYGMRKEQLSTMGAFSQFERKLHEQQGSGLGLIISKRMTELYGGQFAIASVPNQGTTVSVSLPLMPKPPNGSLHQ